MDDKKIEEETRKNFQLAVYVYISVDEWEFLLHIFYYCRTKKESFQSLFLNYFANVWIFLHSFLNFTSKDKEDSGRKKLNLCDDKRELRIFFSLPFFLIQFFLLLIFMLFNWHCSFFHDNYLDGQT